MMMAGMECAIKLFERRPARDIVWRSLHLATREADRFGKLRKGAFRPGLGSAP